MSAEGGGVAAFSSGLIHVSGTAIAARAVFLLPAGGGLPVTRRQEPAFLLDPVGHGA